MLSPAGRARSKLHVPALWALNDRLLDALADVAQLRLFKGRRLVCADGAMLASAQRALGLYLPGTELMLHVVVDP